MRIGELLVMNGLITEEQLEGALKQQIHSNKKIGELLIEEKLISERQLAEALEFQLGIPVVNMNEVEIDRSVIRLIQETTARKYGIVPIGQQDGKIKVAMVDPLNQEAIKEIQAMTGMTVRPFIATRDEIEKAIIDQYGVVESVEQLSEIIEHAFEKEATDIHFIPAEEGLVILYRIDGNLKDKKTLPISLQDSVIGRIKTLASMKTDVRSVPQTGRIRKKLNGHHYEIQASTLPTVGGETVVLRITDQSRQPLALKELGLSEPNLKAVEEQLHHQRGLILISGPAFSGRTTTHYSMVDHQNKEERKIISIEQNIQRRVMGSTQVEINPLHGFTYEQGLTAIMHQDPDIIMIGDIPDGETVEAATRVALADKLVIGSIHGTSALKTIRRLMDMEIEPYLIATSLSMVINQRVIRKVCDRCAHSEPVSDEEMKLFEQHGLIESNDPKNKQKSSLGNFRSFVTTNKSGKMAIIRGDGCLQCNNSGYHGHLALQEVLVMDDTLREMIINKRPYKVMEQYLKDHGFKPMLYDGLLKAREGLTTVEEVLKVN